MAVILRVDNFVLLYRICLQFLQRKILKLLTLLNYKGLIQNWTFIKFFYIAQVKHQLGPVKIPFNV